MCVVLLINNRASSQVQLLGMLKETLQDMTEFFCCTCCSHWVTISEDGFSTCAFSRIFKSSLKKKQISAGECNQNLRASTRSKSQKLSLSCTSCLSTVPFSLLYKRLLNSLVANIHSYQECNSTYHEEPSLQ